MEVRDAGVADLPGILDIFNEVIANSTAVWFDSLDDLRGRRRWFEARQVRGFPILVAVEDGSVLGYSTFGDFRAWHGYRHTVEHSVYVRADRRRTGNWQDFAFRTDRTSYCVARARDGRCD